MTTPSDKYSPCPLCAAPEYCRRQGWCEGTGHTVNDRPAAPLPETGTLSVEVGCMEESNGRKTWIVLLKRRADEKPWDSHQVYADEIEGRAQYEAANLRHFLGLGPEPDLLAFDTAPRSATRTSGRTVRDAAETAEDFSGPPAIVSTTGPRSDGCWVIFYEDPAKEPDVFKGAGAEAAARAKFRQADDNWNCHLLAPVCTPAHGSCGLWAGHQGMHDAATVQSTTQERKA